MAKKYLLVEVTAEKITLLKKVKETERENVLSTKEKKHQLWTVKTFKDGIAQIDNHNSIILKGVKDRTESIKNRTQIQKSVGQKEWDWSKVSRKVKDRLIEYFEKKDYLNIFIIHNELELTDDNYCCDGYKKKVDFNMEKAIEDGVV